jgi:hypothetical protein
MSESRKGRHDPAKQSAENLGCSSCHAFTRCEKLWLLKGEAFNPVRICSNGPGFRVCVRTRSVSAGVSRDVSSLRDSPLNLSLPGTEVAGYRLCRPCGTILLRPVNDTAIAALVYVIF